MCHPSDTSTVSYAPMAATATGDHFALGTLSSYAIPESVVGLLSTMGDRYESTYQEPILIPRSYSRTIQFGSATSLVRLRGPVLVLTVSDEDRDGTFVVTDAFSSVYGEGESDDAAIEDYVVSLIEHFQDLVENIDILAPGLRREYEAMSQVLAHAK